MVVPPPPQLMSGWVPYACDNATDMSFVPPEDTAPVTYRMPPPLVFEVSRVHPNGAVACLNRLAVVATRSPLNSETPARTQYRSFRVESKWRSPSTKAPGTAFGILSSPVHVAGSRPAPW